jgi:hypothetical protein
MDLFYVLFFENAVLYNFRIIQKINPTKTIAKTGKKTANNANRIEKPDSKKEITGLANPAVATDEANLVPEVDVFIAVAVPPPAIIAKVQVIKGSKLATVESMIAVPATAAMGTAIVSKILSIQGIKYARISTIVAIPKVIIAVVLPIHNQLSFRLMT